VTADSAGKQRINLNLDLTGSLTVKGGASNDGDSGIGIFFERDY
jgi:translocation and assembly module TamB